MTDQAPPLLSETSRMRQSRRDRLYASSQGRCFYCGSVITEPGNKLDRDWLFLRPHAVRMVREHVIPSVRGGPDTNANIACACARCNSEKGSFTGHEYRLLLALRSGNLDFRFAGEPASEIKRDWLVCYSSEAFERDLVIHNLPSAVIAYGMRNGHARGPKSRRA